MVTESPPAGIDIQLIKKLFTGLFLICMFKKNGRHCLLFKIPVYLLNELQINQADCRILINEQNGRPPLCGGFNSKLALKKVKN